MGSLSIKQKLIGAFAVVSLVIVCFGGFSLFQMSEINHKSTVITDNWLPSVRVIGRLNTQTSDYRIAEGMHVMSLDSAAMAAADVELDRLDAAIESTVQRYESLISSDHERELFNTFKSLWSQNQSVHVRLITLSRENRNDEAAALFKGESRRAFDDASAQLVTLIQLNQDGAEEASTSGDAAFEFAFAFLVGLGAVGVALAMGTGWLIVRSVSQPILDLSAVMGRLADGDKAVTIPGADRGDELGAMAKTVLVFKDNMIKADSLAAEQEASRKAQLDQAKRLNDVSDRFAKSIEGIVHTVSSAATELQASAEFLSSTAEKGNGLSSSAAAAVEEASVSVQAVSSAAEELSASVAEIGRQVSQSTLIAGKAVEDARRTNGVIEDLASAAQKIGQVVDLISDIADQTNLLALNATIEAARAGEAGRGFAVVAQEVKTLAGETAKATGDISQQITAIQGQVSQSVDAIRAISGTIEEINTISTAIASAIEQQRAATDEIARNAQQASDGTRDVSRNVQGASHAAGETGESASQVLGASNELGQQADSLRQHVAEFIQQIRAG
ncbi:HAMP domain-containing protein [Roseospira marina]|uniref:HAMP domain-containing protein n=1 Tax=Roseospira marina TaxID=140057 RepID=A0A5M6I7P1_9PROT|nr:methyl-accepting chemotaxis protein [Roseospira marina]KAA5604294.1 HAMP domain-containing protein [Roseospira marina]MBB4315683.1 methyl-accepting chemotaxis protein [Roseospira marina]MBB5088741.1 methyl-accepting chemotaxis protein [Roseospira marina]